jgi:hypothetical protein
MLELWQEHAWAGVLLCSLPTKILKMLLLLPYINKKYIHMIRIVDFELPDREHVD